MSETNKTLPAPTQGFDPGEVDSTSVVAFGLVIVAIIVAVFIGVTLFWDKFLIGRYKEVVEGSPNEQLQQLHERETRQLGGYSYVDKSKGQVRIPIDRAMDLLVSEVQAGKTPYPTKDAAKPVEAAAAPVAATAAATATSPAPAAAGEHQQK